MLTDPFFYAVAVPAIILFGLSKSGLGAALSVPSVPLIALAVPPMQAAAIMLPIMIAMDAFAVAAYRRDYDSTTLKLTLPGGLIGVALGWALAAYVTEAHVRLIIGVIAISFALRYWFGGSALTEARPHNPHKARFWSLVSGFTSCISHAGGVPYHMYLLPLRFPPRMVAATAVMFLAAINLAKLVPYWSLGLFDTSTLWTALVLSPLAPLSILIGVRLVSRISMEPFYQLTYAGVLLVGVKMLWDGLGAVL